MNIPDYISHYIEQLRQGDSAAVHSLTEADETAVPLLIAAFKMETDPEVRRGLVYAIWQYRVASTVSFLAGLLQDPDAEVRQQAIDGLITLATPEARQSLEAALSHCRSDPEEQVDFAEYLAEAIELMDQQAQPP